MEKPGKHLLSSLQALIPTFGINFRAVFYPNPASDRITLEIRTKKENLDFGRLKIYNSEDLKKIAQLIRVGKNEVDIKFLEPGIYVARIKFGESERIQRFIKE